MRVLVGAAVCTGAYAALLALGDTDALHDRFAQLILVFWVLCLATAWWVRRGEVRWRRPVLVVVVVAAIAQLPGILIEPRTSSDAYRYVWDGRVQLSGTSPYRYAPLDDRLAELRDPALFPGLSPDDRSGFTTAPLPTDRAALLDLARDDPRTRINRPRVPTLYPPVAQAWFTAVAAVTPWSLGTRGLQIGSAAVAVLLAGALAVWRRRRGDDPLGALWWAWCPTALLEAGNGAHVDVVGAGLVVAGLWVFTTSSGRRGAAWAGGVLLGLAASVKLTPLVMLAAVAPLRGATPATRLRHALPAPVAAVATLVVSYLPHVLVAGGLVVGYLPGYLAEEGGAGRAAVLGLVLPDAWLTPAIVVVVVAVAAWALWRTARSGDQRPDAAHLALVLFGVLLIASTPSYPWYALPLVALAALTGRLEWLGVAVAGYIAYGATTSPPVAGMVYGAASVVVVAATLLRARHTYQTGHSTSTSRVASSVPNEQTEASAGS